MQRGKALFRPHRPARFVNQLVHAAGDAVVNQIQHLAVRVEVQTEFGFVRQFFMKIFDRRRDIQQQQAAQTAPHRLLLFLRIIKQLDRHTVALIHQRRPGFHFIVAAFLLVVIRQIAETPDMQSALLDTIVRNRRERLLHFAFQRILEFSQRAAFVELFVFVIHYPEGDFQMIGHLIPVPGFAVNGHPRHTAQLFLQCIEQRQFQRRNTG
ncbi:hypothetical protein D3C71_1446840 [compost metagenome]